MEPEFISMYNLHSTSPANIFIDTSNMKKRAMDEALITPPKSTPAKSRLVKNPPMGDSSDSRPLSPARSSPITATKAKRQKTVGSARSNGTLTLEELFESLAKRKESGDKNSKPQYSYAVLICLAILQSPEGKLTLSQIYCWISVHFPYYRPKDASWQNSIRHNLSLNSAFTKTEKSSDGKGHFWQVKVGSESKFFKGDYGDYENLRKQVQTIEKYFDIDPAMLEEFDNEKPTYLNRESTNEKKNTSNAQTSASESSSISSTPNADSSFTDLNSTFSIKVSPPEDKPKDGSISQGKEEVFNFGMVIRQNDHNLLDSPYPMKKTELPEIATPLSKSKTERLPTIGDIQDPITTLNPLNSPPNMRRYMCSFNSSFDTDSPSHARHEPSTLLGPVPMSSSPTTLPQITTPYVNRYSEDTTHLKLPPIQVNVLKTPEVNSITNVKTPARFTETPKDSNSILRKLQTPSHLFEDTYLSPMFRAMGTPLKFSATPCDAKHNNLSPRSQQIPGFHKATKFPSSGLFGVDIFSVLKRAGSTSSNAQDKKDESNDGSK